MDDVTMEELADASVVDKGTSSPAHNWLREEALPTLTPSSLEQEPAGDEAGGSTDETAKSTDESAKSTNETGG